MSLLGRAGTALAAVEEAAAELAETVGMAESDGRLLGLSLAVLLSAAAAAAADSPARRR